MKTIKILIFVFLTFLYSCSTIPTKVPELIEVSSTKIEEQNELIFSEWESSIAANNSASKLLELIYKNKEVLLKDIKDDDIKQDLNKFIKGYTPVQSQLSNAISQKEKVLVLKKNLELVVSSIREANSYVAKTVDENTRINFLIEKIKSLK